MGSWIVRDRQYYDKSGELATSIFLAVKYSFDMGIFLDELKPVLVMADNYCIFQGRNGKTSIFLLSITLINMLTKIKRIDFEKKNNRREAIVLLLKNDIITVVSLFTISCFLYY